MSLVPYLVALAPAILLIGLLSTRLALRRASPSQAPDAKPAMREPTAYPRSNTPPGSTETVDIEAELRAIIGRLEPAARANLTNLRYAFRQAGLVRVDAAVLHDVLTTIVATAIRSRYGGQVLLTARPLGRWVEIAVTDDGPIRRRASHHEQLDDARMEAASHGWLFTADIQPDFGTTVSIRLPAAETALRLDQMMTAPHHDNRTGELVVARD